MAIMNTLRENVPRIETAAYTPATETLRDKATSWKNCKVSVAETTANNSDVQIIGRMNTLLELFLIMKLRQIARLPTLTELRQFYRKDALVAETRSDDSDLQAMERTHA